MAFIDYYKIMGIDKNTPQSDIRAAYKKRAKQFHPDLHPNDPKAKAKFQALNEAYDVLGDADKRKKYDQYGENWKNAEAFNGGGFAGYGGQGGGDFDFSQFGGGGSGFSSFFEQLFGGDRRRRSSRSDSPFSGFNQQTSGTINSSIDIDMYTALLGGDIVIQTQAGKLKLKVKPETQNGTKVRLKGKGGSRGDGTYGDLIITYNVKLPTNLNEKQRNLLREMQSAGI